MISTSTARTTGGTGVAVLASAEGISVYDIAADTLVIHDSSVSTNRPGPRLRTPAVVSFVGETSGVESLYELDLESGETAELLRLPGAMTSYDWSPDGTRLAYQLRTSESEPRHLCLFDSRGGTTSQIRAIRRPFGTGTGQREETSVLWSPSGTQILAVETAALPSVFVVDVDGHDVLPPQDGTFARWLSDDRVVFQQDPHTDLVRPWVLVLLATGNARPFDLPNQAYRPSLSPNADMIAFDDGDGEEPAIYVLDVARGTSQLLARGYVAPVWLGPDLIAATAAGRCLPEECFFRPWSPLGATAGFDLPTGELRPLALPTTLQESLRNGVIDVSPG